METKSLSIIDSPASSIVSDMLMLSKSLMREEKKERREGEKEERIGEWA